MSEPSRSDRADLLRWVRENYGDAFAASIVRSLLGAATETPQFDAEVLASMRREKAEMQAAAGRGLGWWR